MEAFKRPWIVPKRWRRPFFVASNLAEAFLTPCGALHLGSSGNTGAVFNFSFGV